MKSVALAAAASLTILTADAQTSSSRHQPVRRTTTQSWHRTTTTRTDNGKHKGWEQGEHKDWNKQVTDTTAVRYGVYHRKRAPMKPAPAESEPTKR